MAPNMAPAPALAAPDLSADHTPIEVRYAKDRFGLFHTFGHCPVVVDGATWDTAEHFILAARAGDDGLAGRIWAAPTARAATREAGKAPDPAGWTHQRNDIIRRLTEAKVLQHPRVAATLLATGRRPLVVHCGHDGGTNVIGAALMSLRKRLPQISRYMTDRTSQWVPEDLRGRPWVLFGEDTLVFPPRVSPRGIPATALHLLTDAAAYARSRTGTSQIRIDSRAASIVQRGAAAQQPMADAAGEDISYVWLPHVEALPSHSRHR